MLDGPGSDVDFTFIIGMLVSPVAHWLTIITLILTGLVWLLTYLLDQPPTQRIAQRKLAALGLGAAVSLAATQILVALFPG